MVKKVAKYINGCNISQKLITNSDENGYFEIYAIENDYISFSSLLYKTKKIIISKTHLNEKNVFQLKEKMNRLEEVILNNGAKIKKFNVKKYNLELKEEILLDIKRIHIQLVVQI